MLDQPFLSSAVARYPLVDATQSDWCPTLATDGYNVFVNSDFCDSLEAEEVLFVLAHEIIHCVFGHTDRRKDRNPKIWNYAIDYATNLMLGDFGFKMPKVGLLNQDFRNLTAEEIYDLLTDPKNKKHYLPGSEEEGELREEGEVGWQHRLESKSPFDSHLEPTDSRTQSLRTEDTPSVDERLRLRKMLSREIQKKLQSQGYGINQSELGMAEGGKVPWQEILAQFFTGLRRDNYRMLPPNKKHLWRNLYLPSLGVPGPDHVVVAIDTSGSMSDKILSEVLAEVDRLRSLSQCSMTLIQCDAAIQKTERFDEWDEAEFTRKRMYGRGGTSFVPVFDWIKKEQEESGMTLDCLFYLTDGYGDSPEHEPPYPVAWIVTEGHCADFGFGSVIEL